MMQKAGKRRDIKCTMNLNSLKYYHERDGGRVIDSMRRMDRLGWCVN